jgi:hypothetical protein
MVKSLSIILGKASGKPVRIIAGRMHAPGLSRNRIIPQDVPGNYSNRMREGKDHSFYDIMVLG